nr:hypothetical protein [Tanacetum cinerariifolium]
MTITLLENTANNYEGLDAKTAQLSSLGREIKKLSEQVHSMCVSFKLCNGSNLSKHCPNKEQVKEDEDIFYGEFYQRPYPNRGIYNVSPNRVFGNEVYGGDSEGFGVNPSSDEFRLCNSDEWRSINGGGPLGIRRYGGVGDMVIRNVSPNGVFGNKDYGGDSEGFVVNPSSDKFRLCNSNEWRSINGGGPLGIHGYGGGDIVIRDGLKGCLDHRILRSSPILPPLQ